MKNKTEKKEPQVIIREYRTEPCRCVQDAARAIVKWMMVIALAIPTSALAVWVVYSWAMAVSGNAFNEGKESGKQIAMCVTVALSAIVALVCGSFWAGDRIAALWAWANKRR